jgi:hypothetical protein
MHDTHYSLNWKSFNCFIKVDKYLQLICLSNRHTNQLERRQQFSCTVLEVGLAAIRHNMYTPDLLHRTQIVLFRLFTLESRSSWSSEVPITIYTA